MSSELLMLLKHEARTHKLCGANALGKLFEASVERIAELEAEQELGALRERVRELLAERKELNGIVKNCNRMIRTMYAEMEFKK